MDAAEMPGVRATTKRREWWGWFGFAAWLFFMMYGHDIFMTDISLAGGGTLYPFYFMALLAISIAVFGWRYGDNPNGLARIAHYTTPVAIAITVVFPLLPPPLGSILYAVSAALMAPAITRRVYGVIHTAGARPLTRYMSGIAVCVALFTLWIIAEPPREAAFFVPAILAFPSWIGIRRDISTPDPPPEVGAFRLTKQRIVMFAVMAAALFWLNSMSAAIHTLIVVAADENAVVPLTLLGFMLPPVGFMLYGFLNDKGLERAGFIGGMTFFIVGILIALLPEGGQIEFMYPLAVADGLGGAFTEFFILTAPIYFFSKSKRPVFIASLGVALNMLTSALFWEVDIWAPEIFLQFGAPVLVSAAISAVVFVLLVYFLFERHREKTLAAALYAFMRCEKPESAVAEFEPPYVPDALEKAGFLPEEREVASLLIDGYTKGEIARKLHVSAADVGERMRSIRGKVEGVRELADESLERVAAEYKLTKRETQILRSLYEGKTNVKIAEELFISEDTVKTHVRNLLKKLPVGNRSELREWMLGVDNE